MIRSLNLTKVVNHLQEVVIITAKSLKQLSMPLNQAKTIVFMIGTPKINTEKIMMMIKKVI